MFGAILGAVAPALVGGLFRRKEQKSAQRDAVRMTDAQNAKARAEFLADRKYDEAREKMLTQNERNYIRSEKDYDRHRNHLYDVKNLELAERSREKDRAENRKDASLASQRAREDATTAHRRSVSDYYLSRDDAREDLRNARAYEESTHAKYREQYNSDILKEQARANATAEAQAASRGVDLQQMRKDAEAAGFNPLTWLQMGGASAYNKEVNYQHIGGTYVPGVSAVQGGSGTFGAGGGGGGGGGVVGASAAMPIGSGGVSGFASGGSLGGSGYTRQFAPVLSSGSFIGDAMERGLDTVFNTPPARDPLADALREALATREVQETAERRVKPYQGFGYDLTSEQPYRASVSAGKPPMGKAPGQTSVYADGKRFDIDKGWTPAADVEDEYGGAIGEVYGGARGYIAMQRNMHKFGKETAGKLLNAASGYYKKYMSKPRIPPKSMSKGTLGNDWGWIGGP